MRKSEMEAALRERVPVIPLAKGTAFNKLVDAGTNIFATNLTLTYNVGIFRITVAVNPASVVRVRIIRDAVSKDLDLNAGASLSVDALYTFDVPLRSGDQFNMRTAVGTTIQYLNVDEVGAFST